ncbi:MAG: lipid-binding SYLF domain-containing protein [Mariprofundaceae bacterium]
MHIQKLLALTGMLLLMPAWAAADKAVSARDKLTDATDVIEEIMASPDKGIPRDLLRKAAGIAIFPNVIKAGFVFGGKYGRGVIVHHNKSSNRWSAPGFFSIGAGSVGWQIGAQSTDLILLIRSERGLKSLIKHEFTLGGDASVAAGPVGRKAEMGVDVGFKAEILSYSRSRGLFAGLSLEGAKLNVLDDYNSAYYGKSLSAREILFEGKARAPKSGVRLIQTLKKYSK